MADRVRWEKCTGVGRRRHGRSGDTDLKRPSEEQGGGCFARQGLLRSGRGETAGDCVYGEEPFRTAALDRYPPTWCRGKGSGLPPRRTNAGPVRRGVSDRSTSLRGLAEQRGAHKPVAKGGIVAEELSDPGFEPWQPGAPGDWRQLLWVKSSCNAVPPFVRPIASEYPPTLGSHGVPQWDRGDDTDKMEPERPKEKIESIWRYDAPQGRLSRAGEGFSPAVSHVQGRIYLTHPFTVIESTAGGAALVAAAQAADRDCRGGSHITI